MTREEMIKDARHHLSVCSRDKCIDAAMARELLLRVDRGEF